MDGRFGYVLLLAIFTKRIIKWQALISIHLKVLESTIGLNQGDKKRHSEEKVKELVS